VRKFYYIFLLSLIVPLFGSFTSTFKPIYGVKVIVLDPGHGGKDPGCHGVKTQEKDVALAVALKLGKYIQENLKDVKVVYTRSTDVFVELQERAEIANKAKADLFISIHCNSACVRDKKLKKDICKDQIHGAETYVMGIKNEKGKLDIAKRENSAILLEDNYVQKYDGFDPNSDESYIIMSMFADTYLDQSLSFASKTQKQYSTHAARYDKGVKRASLWVLWRTYMPSVLTEIGYLTNPEEEKFLGSTKGQDYVASSLFKAFREYKDEIEGNTKKYDDEIEKRQPYKITAEDLLDAEKQKLDSKVNKPSTDSLSGTKVVDKTTNHPKNHKDSVVKPVDAKPVVEASKAKIVYKVQLMSADKAISLNSDKFKNVPKPGEYIEKGVYKYTAGEFSKKQEAVDLQNTLRKKGFKDAFVIATQDGKRVPLK
jgi:N-acetylmuramoyl-L-alanine amidase